MPATFQALAVVVVAVLPGALFVWYAERAAGPLHLNTGDRVLRFVGYSAIFLVLLSPMLVYVWRQYLHVSVWTGSAAQYVSVLDGVRVDGWFFVCLVAYVVIPIASGLMVGRSARKHHTFGRYVLGDCLEARGWDRLFADESRSGVVKLRLKSGKWVGGLYSGRSYASGPEAMTSDLLLQDTYAIDQAGTWITKGNDYLSLGTMLLIRWEEVEYMQFQSY